MNERKRYKILTTCLAVRYFWRFSLQLKKLALQLKVGTASKINTMDLQCCVLYLHISDVSR